MRPALVPHRDAFVPAKADTSALPDTLTDRIWAIDIHMLRQAEGWCEVLKPFHRAAMHDPQPLLLDRHMRLRGCAVRDSEIVDEDAIVLVVFIGHCVAVGQTGI